MATAERSGLVPYRLGLQSPRDVCLGVDVSEVSYLWGPGTAPGERPVWKGGGLEFYCAEFVPSAQIKSVNEYSLCGDPQWASTTA